MAVVPAASSKPSARTSPAAGAGPCDTTIATALPAVTWTPAAGVELITLPFGIVAWNACVTAPTINPAFVIAVVAAACVRLTTFGTVLSAGPSETVSAMPLPGLTLVPAAGAWLITVPAAAALFTLVMEPATTPAFVSAVVAAACVRPTTFGTSAPRDTVIVTVLPNGRSRPAAGFWLITLPIATVGLFASTDAATRSAFTIAVCAAAWVKPTTFGTTVVVEPPPAPGAATVASENCSRSMLRSVSVPVSSGGVRGVTCVTVTVPFALSTKAYSAIGFG